MGNKHSTSHDETKPGQAPRHCRVMGRLGCIAYDVLPIPGTMPTHNAHQLSGHANAGDVPEYQHGSEWVTGDDGKQHWTGHFTPLPAGYANRGRGYGKTKGTLGWSAQAPPPDAEISDYIPIVGTVVRLERASELEAKGQGGAAVTELEWAAVDGVMDVLPVGDIAKAAGGALKVGGRAVIDSVAAVTKGGINVVARDAPRAIETGVISGVKVAEHSTDPIMGAALTHAAANEATHAATEAALHESVANAEAAVVHGSVEAAGGATDAGLQAALHDSADTSAHTLDHSVEALPKSQLSRAGTTVKNLGLVGGTALGATAAAGVLLPAVGSIDSLLHPLSKEEQRRADYRAGKDPLFGYLDSSCRGAMTLAFQDSKSCAWVKFASPALMGAGMLYVIPHEIAVAKRLAVAVGTSSVYYVWKEGLFKNFKSGEDGGGVETEEDGGVVGSNTRHVANAESWYNAMEAKFGEH